MGSLAGRFITVDGPNGVGKSSLVAALSAQLTEMGIPHLITSEPTASMLGRFVRESEEAYVGMALACLVAADRYWHLEQEVLPALAQGVTVLCDRYIASSLVLQGLDGVDTEYIWALNSRVRVPDLSVVLSAPAALLTARLGQRKVLTRFERSHAGQAEAHGYDGAAQLLQQLGFSVLLLDTGTTSLEQHVGTVLHALAGLP